MDLSCFSPYQKRTSGSRRKLKKIICQSKTSKQTPCQMINIPVLKAFGQKIFLSKISNHTKLTKKSLLSEDDWNQKNKMMLVAKKIGCYIEPPLYLEGLGQNKKDNKVQKNSREEDSTHDTKNDKELESTMNDKQLRFSYLKPSSVSIETYRIHKSLPKTIPSVSDQKLNSLKYVTYKISTSKNNQELVRKILSTRKHWKQIKKGQGTPNFKWLAGDYEHSIFEKGKSTATMKKALNQFESHHEITTKNGLIRNLQFYMETKKLQLFSMTPITFIIDFDEEYCQFNLRQFLNFFIKHQLKGEQGSTSINRMNSYQRVNSFVQKLKPYFNPHPQLRKKLNPLSKPQMTSQYINGNSYLWLLKPTGLNRGRGIQIFDNLQSLQRFLLNYLHLAGRKSILLQNNNKNTKKQLVSINKILPSIQNQEQQILLDKPSNEQFILKACSFVIQKYIQKPMLLNGRKFDIRVWVLLNYDFSLYFFKQGYLRLSSQQFSFDANNYFIHLTNNAIQKHSKQYGSKQQGNQMSFQTFKLFLQQQNRESEFDSILSKIKQYSYTAINSVKNKLNPRQQKHCFQLFGFDYIIDSNCKVWLIQVNNNPCIQLSSPLLSKLIPRMLNDAFKLSLDKIFKFNKDDFLQKINPQKPMEHSKPETYQVEGYSNSDNMWQLLGKLSPNSQYLPK